jgi:hypothetical protein
MENEDWQHIVQSLVDAKLATNRSLRQAPGFV